MFFGKAKKNSLLKSYFDFHEHAFRKKNKHKYRSFSSNKYIKYFYRHVVVCLGIILVISRPLGFCLTLTMQRCNQNMISRIIIK